MTLGSRLIFAFCWLVGSGCRAVVPESHPPEDADGDGAPFGEDCDDADPARSPGFVEQCDPANVDEDCSGAADDADPAASGAAAWYADADGDGFGDEDAERFACDPVAGEVARSDDCNDARADIHPGASEPDCTDPTDYDCDGLVAYADADADGAAACEDCDDTDATRSPLLAEVCDPADVDEDCSGAADDADPNATGTTAWFADADADGAGDATTQRFACDPAPGEVATAADCDDGRSDVYPGAPEPDCTDPTDYDCDGRVVYADADADGVAACEDCDDADPTRSPLHVEVCDAGDVDEDCSGAADDADRAPSGTTAWYLDADADGAGDASTERYACDPAAGEVASASDCDDGRSDVYPGAPEPDCTDPTDYDCDGRVVYADADADGVAACEDCDDADAGRSPLLAEVCDAGDVDEDCSGAADDADPGATGATAWYTDGDGDGFGDAATERHACDPGAGEVSSGSDCDDGRADIHPGASEPDCTDPTDYDCDGAVRYADADADGVAACEDCDDADPTRSPLLAEVCDPADVDEDCSGAADDADAAATGPTPWYTDADGDAAGDPATVRYACDPAAGEVADDTDCDDTAADVSPSAWEVCEDGVDQDCTGADEDCRFSGTYAADGDAQVTIFGGYASGGFGITLLTGDFNGDGNTDLLAGANNELRVSPYRGSVYGYYSLPTSGAVEAGDWADFDYYNNYPVSVGSSLQAVGDINADGADDFGVVIHTSSAIFYGGDTGSIATRTAADLNPSGEALAPAGNFMGGSSSTDWISGYWNDYTGDGGAYGYTGASSTKLASFRGASSGEHAGQLLAGGTDWNGDGIADIAIGAPFADVGAANTGSVHIVYGPAPAYLHLSGADATITGDGTRDYLGYGLAPLDDADGDGQADLALWSQFASSGASISGAVYVLNSISSATVSSLAMGTVPGRVANDMLASGDAKFGDIDADGELDLAVSSYSSSDHGAYAGMAWLVYGPLVGTLDLTTAAASFTPSAAGDYFGVALALLPAPSGDGTLDLAVGALYGDSPTLTDAGAGYLFRTP